MSIKLGTKIWSDYYFSSMKLIVTTFLVYKVKKCLLKSGKVTIYNKEEKSTCCPNYSYLFGHSLPTSWAMAARLLFTSSPSRGPRGTA